jgi:hypothetical protein
MCLIVPYYCKAFEDEINCIMKIKVPFMKVMSLNETIKHLLFKPNFNIRIFFLFIKKISISILFNKDNFP